MPRPLSPAVADTDERLEGARSALARRHPQRACHCREGLDAWHRGRVTCDGCGGSLMLGPWAGFGQEVAADPDDELVVLVD